MRDFNSLFSFRGDYITRLRRSPCIIDSHAYYRRKEIKFNTDFKYSYIAEPRYNDPRYSDILSNTIRPYGPVLF